MVDHQRVKTGLADHQGLLNFAVVGQPEKALLVGAKLACETLIQVAAHQAAENGNTGPGLRFQHQCVDEAIIASEPGWFEMIVHFEVLASCENAATAAFVSSKLAKTPILYR